MGMPDAKYNQPIMKKTTPIQNLKLHHPQLLGDLALLLVALVWGSTFVIQRIAAQQGGLYFFNGTRFLVGSFIIAPFAIPRMMRYQRSNSRIKETSQPGWKMLTGAVILAGSLLSLGSGLQQSGMQYTTAGNAGFITGLYVVLVPFILAVVFHQRIKPVIWLAALMATSGLYMLSLVGKLHINLGDGLVLLGTIFWALHVILIGWIVKHLDVFIFASGQYFVCGLVSFIIGAVAEKGGFAEISGLWGWIFFMGIFSTSIGFTLQAFGQRTAPPADAALILSMETVFAAISGWIFLGENLSMIQIIGCATMLLGMLLAQVDVLKMPKGSSTG